MQKADNKNFVLAIVLSMLIVFGWQYFYVAPMLDQQQASQPQTTQQQAQPGAIVPGSAVGGVVPREQALAGTKRLPIESTALTGSINLEGARLDDLHLMKYKETIAPGSPTIVLLSPSGSPNAYFAEQGLVPAQGTALKVPDSKTVWQAPEGAVLSTGKPVTLTWDNGEGVVFSRTISLDDEYVFSITQTVENKSAVPVSVLPYGRIQRQDTPVIAGFWVFFEGALAMLDGTLNEIHYSDLKDDKQVVKIDSANGWLGFTDKYWATAMVPQQGKASSTAFQHLNQNGRDAYQAEYIIKEPITIVPGGTASYQEQLYAGAKVVQQIEAVGAKYGIPSFEFMIDWGWFPFLTKPMFWLLALVQSFVGNFGVAILAITVIVKLAVFPLANKSYASMSKMKKLQPEMEKLKELHGDDRMKVQQGMMELYKREKVSPVSGCLPVLVQIPIFFALYKVILTSIELRHAPFFGWIKDLSAADPTSVFNLFGLIPYEVPQFLLIGVWPLLMGITMWIQMRLNPTPPDPVQASLFNWMPVIFTFMLGTFPAGLVIYWAWSNFLSIVQQSYIMKRHGVEVDLLGNIRDSLPFLKKKPAS
ncbi:MAG: membrane protein insertase YidC [Aestuariivirga sp.]